MRVARVALDVPLPTLFDYRLPAAFEREAEQLLGRRVVVSFGRSRQVGVVLEAGVEPAVNAARIKPIAHVFENETPLPPDVIELLHFASDYYHHPLGQVVLNALPQKLRRAPARALSPEQAISLTDRGRDLSLASLPARAMTKRRLLGLLHERGAVTETTLKQMVPAAARALRELQRLGLVQRQPAISTSRDAPWSLWRSQIAVPGPPLTDAQQAAVQAVLSAGERFSPFLLRGVTGSGKTEVYLQIVAEVLLRGRQVLVLVPEINLTPQLLQRFRARFPGVMLVALHSHLAEGERVRAWRAAERAEAAVIIGTRLAVYAPLPRLGLIVVDEEHDSSYKQQEGLRYSARDLALFRGKLREVPVLLGSATPSLESYANSIANRYALFELPSRPGASLPSIRCVDTRGERLWHGLSGTLRDALQTRLARKEQSLVFVNRRGYAPALVCLACGWASSCTRCSARLVLHLKQGRLRCHYCGHEEPVIRVCSTCGNQDLMPAGHGTQRVESALQEALPGARVLRIDADTTRRRDAFQAMQAQIRANEVDVLVGTQMLAKGHDFPRLTLVGVVNADDALYSSDFRASERLYAQLTQVAGRAGRSELPGDVLIQTNFPDHPLYEAVCRQDYEAFARSALDERRQIHFPPYSHLALLRAEATRREAVNEYLAKAARLGAELSFRVEIYDPIPPFVARVAGRERAHLLIQAVSRNELQRFLTAWHPRLAEAAGRNVRWSLDVDPLEI